MHNKIKAGFYSFTEITDPKEHRSYNEWHHLDHVPENRALPGIIYGERWAATPDLMKARMLAAPGLANTHYFTLYLMAEPLDRTLKDFYDLGTQLGAVGRFHMHRKGVLGGPMLFIKGYAAPRVLVAPEAIPYRPTKGVFITVSDVVDPKLQTEVNQWYDQVHIPDMMTVTGVAGVYWFMAEGAAPKQTFAQDNPRGRVLRVYYLDEEPMTMLEDMRKKLPQWQAAGRMYDLPKAVNTIFASAFRTILPLQYDFADEMGRYQASQMAASAKR